MANPDKAQEQHAVPEGNTAERARHNLQAAANSERQNQSTPPAKDRTNSSDQVPHYNTSSLYAPAAGTQRQRWTMAIDLTTSIRDEHGQLQAGAENKWQQLQKMAEETRGKPVTLVVSVPREEQGRQGGQRSSQAPSREGAAKVPGADGPPVPTIDTYIVRDGQITKVESHRTDGMAGDVKDLLQTAAKVAPSDHLGLVVQAHGTGLASLGIAGDTGTATMSQLHDALKDGLSASGRSQLDVLDFDACQMASTDTVKSMHDVTRFMVASADEELADDKHRFDGQNLGAVVHDLLATPDQSAREVAHSFVAEADRGSNGTPYATSDDRNHQRSGTDTLASIDMAQYKPFEQSFDQLGTALDQALRTQGNKEAIEAVVDQTGAVPGRMPGYEAASRDTGEFARGILQAVQQGKIHDQDGALGRAAASFIDAQGKLVANYHGTDGYYRNMDGLSAILPATSEQSRRQMAASLTPAGALQSLGDRMSSINAQSAAVRYSSQFLAELKGQVPAGDQKQLQPIIDAQKQISQAKTQEQYSQALDAVRVAAGGFLQTESGAVMIDKTRAMLHPRSTDTASDPWSRFVSALNG